jgi:hypothetical protein
MTVAPFHLAWFLQGSSVQAWGEKWTGNISEDWMSCDMFLDLARGCAYGSPGTGGSRIV